MHFQSLKLPISFSFSSPRSGFSQNPRIINRLLLPVSAKYGAPSISNCYIFAPKNRPSSPSLVDGRGEEDRLKSTFVKEVDVVTLGNLCVDIVLNVPKLPPASFEERRTYMEQLAASSPDKIGMVSKWCNMGILGLIIASISSKVGHWFTSSFSRTLENEASSYADILGLVLSYTPCDKLMMLKTDVSKRFWEAGGNCNMAIAAARLGLHCLTLGHVGNETYGRFLLDVLHDEGIGIIRMDKDADSVASPSASYETLLCWVLVDPFSKHGFCSRADFIKEPAFSWMRKLSGEARMAIKKSKILFCNGYGFDEFSPSLIVSALDHAMELGTSVFFDPGPRGKSLSVGTHEQQMALDRLLRMSDVLLLTSDEAEPLTGIADPVLAGKELLKKGVRTKWVIIKMGPKGSILITMSSISYAPAFKVNVIDTVGCGDSFVAAIAFGFLHDMPTVNTLALANAVGAATAMGCGAGRNVATLESVIKLMKVSDLNEKEHFWNELLENVDTPEILLLSRTRINGSNNQLKHVSLQDVVSELLYKLQTVQERVVTS